MEIKVYAEVEGDQETERGHPEVEGALLSGGMVQVPEGNFQNLASNQGGDCCLVFGIDDNL